MIWKQNDPWIGVDLDGTLAEYNDWIGPEHIGPPVPLMADRVRAWLQDGKRVKIMTARISQPSQRAMAYCAIMEWCFEHFGEALEVTQCKDYAMVELWDDRAVAVEKNTGVILGGVSKA